MGKELGGHTIQYIVRWQIKHIHIYTCMSVIAKKNRLDASIKMLKQSNGITYTKYRLKKGIPEDKGIRQIKYKDIDTLKIKLQESLM